MRRHRGEDRGTEEAGWRLVRIARCRAVRSSDDPCCNVPPGRRPGQRTVPGGFRLGTARGRRVRDWMVTARGVGGGGHSGRSPLGTRKLAQLTNRLCRGAVFSRGRGPR